VTAARPKLAVNRVRRVPAEAVSLDRLPDGAIAACYDFIAQAAAGGTACFTCGGSFAVPVEHPWAVLVVHAAIPHPISVHCAGICTSCCTTMDALQLQCLVMRAFSTWRVLAISTEAGHA
jgi:hypothetical protein